MANIFDVSKMPQKHCLLICSTVKSIGPLLGHLDYLNLYRQLCNGVKEAQNGYSRYG